MKINHIIKEFVAPQATAQDPGLEREKDVDVIFYGQMPQDFTANTVAEALEEVLPREYPPGSSNTTNSNVYRVVTEIAKHQGAVVTTKPLSIAQKLVKTFQTYGIKCRIDTPGLEEGFVDTVKDKYAQVKDYFDDSPEAVERKLERLRASNAEAQPGANAVAPVQQSAEDPYMILGIQPGADSDAIKLAYRRLAKQHHPDAGGNAAEFQKIKTAFNELLASGAVVREGTAGLPDPQDYDSDWDYYNDRDADPTPPDTDADYENMDDAESDDWFDESKEKIGNMDADAFDAALSRMKKLAGAGPLRTVYDPARRVYKNVPHAVQPAQQPKKSR
jgi:hypothetical protein